MQPALIMLSALVLVGTVLWLLDRHSRQRDEDGKLLPNQVTEPESACSDDCCGSHEVCPSEQLLRGEMCPVTYYDDQELDDYRGRSADDYTATELEQWRDVLYTLQPADRLGWERSIKRRGIIMPQPIRDELLMLLQE
ncbi:MAG: phospholipase [Muribaculaceae bacterium]|nr:phospholipase [Muribaculaceae bacterium]